MSTWLIERDSGQGLLFLSTAVGETSVGFTEDAYRAWQFPSKEAAQIVFDAIKMGDRICEHVFEDDTPFGKRQALCRDSGTRYYGDGGTIHGTQLLNVETDIEGNVLSVWFRCQPLPFEQVVVGRARAREMREMGNPRHKLSLHGVEVRDRK